MRRSDGWRASNTSSVQNVGLDERGCNVASVARDDDDRGLRGAPRLELIRLARVGRRRVDQLGRSQPIGDPPHDPGGELSRGRQRLSIELDEVLVRPALDAFARVIDVCRPTLSAARSNQPVQEVVAARAAAAKTPSAIRAGAG